MSEALRSVLAEFGFDVDLPTLEKLDQKIRDSIKATEKSTKANDDHFAKLKKNAKEERSAHAAKQAFEASAEGKEHAAWKRRLERQQQAAQEADALADRLSSWGGILEQIDQKVASSLGENLTSRFQGLDAMAARFGVTAAGVGRVVIGASLAIVGALHRGVTAAFAFANAFAADSEALRDTAREMRVTTTDLQEFDHAAAQSGVGVERMRAGILKFSTDLRAAERWGNGTTGMLRRLGIQARGADGHIRPTSDVMNDVSVALERIPNPTRRARVAVQLFGESGRRMLDVLHSGPGGLIALRDELAELGGGVTPEATEASRRYTQEMERLKIAQDSLRSILATALLPALSWVVRTVTDVTGWFARMSRGTHVAQIGLALLAAVGVAGALALIVAWAPVVAPFLLAAGAILQLILLLDDLITFVEGGDSALGRFVDSLFGVGTATEYAHELREEWEAIVDAISRATEVLVPFLALAATDTPATGRLGRPRVGAQGNPRPAGRPRPGGRPGGTAADLFAPVDVASIPTVNAGGRVVPATRTVAAPSSVTNRTNVQQITRAPVYHFEVSGPDATVVTNQVMQRIRAAEQAQRDADHPQEDDG